MKGIHRTSHFAIYSGCLLMTLSSRPVYATDVEVDGGNSPSSEAITPSNVQSTDAEVRSAGPVTPGKPSPVFTQAQSDFNDRHWVEAAIGWNRVVQGETADGTSNHQLGEYYLGICLFRLGLLQPSLDVFGALAEERSHLRFAETLPWLARLAEQLPEPGDIVTKLSKYSESDISQFNSTGDSELKSIVNYWYGRARYSAAQYDGAIGSFQKVDKLSGHYIAAQFFVAASYVRKRQSVPAIHAFQGVIAALDKNTARIKDAQHLRDLAHLSLARIYYSGSIRLNPETNVPTVSEEPLNVAFQYWRGVSQDGAYWLDAQYEQAWAYFMAGDYSGALGNIHTIRSPFFQDSQYPEADILKAVIYYANCNYEAAMISSARFNQRYMPIRADLDEILAKYKHQTPESLFEFLMQLREHRTQLASTSEAVAANVWNDRALLRNYEYVQVIDREQRRLEQLPAELRASKLGERVRAGLVDARRRFVAATVTHAAGYFGNFVARIQEMVRDGEKLLIDTLASGDLQQGDSTPTMYAFTANKAHDKTARFRELNARTDGSATHRPVAPSVGSKRILSDAVAVPAPVVTVVQRPYGLVTTDDDHIRWPFDGEYWRDELGTYRQTILSTCGGNSRGRRRNLL